MMLGGTPSEVNPNSLWLNSRGMWLSYTIGVLLLHLILLSFPFLSVALVWTLTNIFHNTAMFFFLHILKGTPWESGDQGRVRFLTHWEQIDNGEQFTATRKFLTVVPIILFILASFYTKYDFMHFIFNFSFLVLVLLPKLPQFHMLIDRDHAGHDILDKLVLYGHRKVLTGVVRLKTAEKVVPDSY